MFAITSRLLGWPEVRLSCHKPMTKYTTCYWDCLGAVFDGRLELLGLAVSLEGSAQIALVRLNYDCSAVHHTTQSGYLATSCTFGHHDTSASGHVASC
ncbi:hypothetical protein LZ31DRAFT_549124 [Colletotrichum somersetense]|nr:hypothetical protein LZ31DRAFT_549124 [Colletotrichum somersetense]